MILYVDFDRTLFDTETFVADRDKVLRQEFSVDLKREDTDKSYRLVGEFISYDFYGHMSQYGLTVYDIEQRLKPALKQQRSSYVYEDAIGLIENCQFKVLTFGEDDYQKFKFEFAPELDAIEKIIVFEHKDEYLSRQHAAGERVVLVDDKPDASRSHPAFEFIHLDRQGELPFWQDEAGIHINSLDQLGNVLK